MSLELGKSVFIGNIFLIQDDASSQDRLFNDFIDENIDDIRNIFNLKNALTYGLDKTDDILEYLMEEYNNELVAEVHTPVYQRDGEVWTFSWSKRYIGTIRGSDLKGLRAEALKWAVDRRNRDIRRQEEKQRFSMYVKGTKIHMLAISAEMLAKWILKGSKQN